MRGLNRITPNSPKTYRWFVILGICVVFIIISLAYSFFIALSDSQLVSRKQSLNKQVELASKEIQKSFRTIYEDMVFFVNNLEPWAYERTSNEELAFEKRIRRIFNNHRNVLDTVFVVFPNHIVSFHFNDQNSFIKTTYKDRSEIPLGSKFEIAFSNQSKGVEMIIKINMGSFLGDGLGNYYLGSSGEKLVYIDGEIFGINEFLPQEGFDIDDATLGRLVSDIKEGVRGQYEGFFNNSNSEKDFFAIIHQYPFNFFPLEEKFAFIFLQDKKSVTSGVFGTYFYLLLVLLLLLVIVILFLYYFIKNTQISNQILAGNALEINELFRRQTLLLQESKGFIYFQNADSKITSVSEEVSQVLGYSKEYFLINFKEHISKDAVHDLEELTRKSIAEKKEVISFEFDYRKLDGEWIRVKIFEKLLYDEQGEFIGNVGICTDINEKYLAEQELLKSENRLRAVLKSLPDLIFIYNRQGVFLDYYVQNENLLIQPAAESMGKRILEVLPEPLNREIMDKFEKAISTGKVQTVEFELMLNTGKRIFETRLFKLDDQRVISIARDITAQKLWEKGLKEAVDASEQANIAKSEFLANMSHEIRTPMNGLLGIIGLMENTPLSPQQKEYLHVIKDSGHSLIGIINDILDYSKIEAGMMSLNISIFHFKKEIEKILKIFSGLVKEKNIHLKYQFGPLMPEYIQLDKDKLGQILFNLIGNAIKFTPAGGEISLNITGETILENNILLIFSIKDSGIGIPDSKIKTLAEPFVQVDGSATREHNGTGLGLAISKKLIELMGGDLQVESKEGVGSTFTFNVFGTVWSREVELTSNNGTNESDDFDWNNMAEQFPLDILLVEDNDTNLQFMQMLMKQLGYTIEIARHGYEAIEQVEEKSYDLIFMDIQMPKMNGLEATKLIREMPQGADLKIIGLSANAFQEDIQIARNTGMDDYLTKPVKIQDIASAIKKCYDEKKKRVN